MQSGTVVVGPAGRDKPLKTGHLPTFLALFCRDTDIHIAYSPKSAR